MPDQVPEEVKEARFHRFMELQQEISARRLQQKVGKVFTVLVDEVDEEGIIARSMADAPEIDGVVYIDNPNRVAVKAGQFIEVEITRATPMIFTRR